MEGESCCSLGGVLEAVVVVLGVLVVVVVVRVLEIVFSSSDG